MSRLSDLLRQVERTDAQLAADLRAEVKALSERRQFGLNFERHVPEAVDLPGRPVRRGDKVRILPERGSTAKPDPTLRVVLRVAGDLATVAADGEVSEVPLADLVVVAEFRDPIFPGLVSTGNVERGGDKPFHTVINAENFHALEALLYTHEGKVDAIYIDPPYNTQDADWKYNNKYVDSADIYRHSKWLAMMERRLRLAARLMVPGSGVLAIAIDENEGARLALLLEQLFPEYAISPVHVVHNPRGVQGDNFSFVHETVYFVIPRGGRQIAARVLSEEEIATGTSNLRNWGGESERLDAANCFYPVYVSDGAVVGFGDDVTRDGSVHPRHNETGPGRSVAVWPVDAKGVERKWRYARHTVEAIAGLLTVKILTRGALAGDVEVLIAKEEGKAKTVWQGSQYDASTHGTQMLGVLAPGRRFPFAKSLYAVEECIDLLARHKPNAVILDFFAGSGTTAHAVMRLNKQDGGRRQCISVTNNEVSAEEQKRLRAQGLRPGDPEWEQWGICDYITKPRIEAAITGRTPDGDSIKGDYKFTDEFPMVDGFQENVEFFTMTYEAPRAVQHGKSFEAIAPLLWLKAGARGRRIDVPTEAFDVAEAYGVLFDVDAAGDFLAALLSASATDHGPRMAFIVTDDERAFQMVCAELPESVEPVRLYESYLTSFAVGGSA